MQLPCGENHWSQWQGEHPACTCKNHTATRLKSSLWDQYVKFLVPKMNFWDPKVKFWVLLECVFTHTGWMLSLTTSFFALKTLLLGPKTSLLGPSLTSWPVKQKLQFVMVVVTGGLVVVIVAAVAVVVNCNGSCNSSSGSSNSSSSNGLTWLRCVIVSKQNWIPLEDGIYV